MSDLLCSSQADFDRKIPNFFRCINKKDCIPHYITPSWRGWRHIGVFIHMTDSKLYYDHEPEEFKDTDWEKSTGQKTDFANNHKMDAYHKNLEMYRCLNLMEKSQVDCCQKAWFDFIRPLKVQTVASLPSIDDADDDEKKKAAEVTFTKSIEPNFYLLPDHFRNFLYDSKKIKEGEVKGQGKISLDDFEIMLRKGR